MAKISKSAARPRLGRGLSSLVNSSLHRPDDGQDDVIPADAAAKASKTRETAPEAAPDGKPLDVPIGQIQPNPYQPRRQFEPEQLVELAASIAEQGILQPLVVCRAAEGEGSYVLVAGEPPGRPDWLPCHAWCAKPLASRCSNGRSSRISSVPTSTPSSARWHTATTSTASA
jgi:hypothetical protein